jgi:hypothetical protein
MNHHGRILLFYGETIPRDLITQSLAWILVHQHDRQAVACSASEYGSAGPKVPRGTSLPSGDFRRGTENHTSIPQDHSDTPLVRNAGPDAALSHNLYLIDGANAFDAYGLARLITRQGQDPRVILKRIHVSRAFTCYQLAERIMTLTPSPLSLREGRGAGGESSPALYLLGLLDTFYDESVPMMEALRLLDQVLARLRQWRARGALVIIVTKLPPVKTKERAVMVRRVQEQADVDASSRIMSIESRGA